MLLLVVDALIFIIVILMVAVGGVVNSFKLRFL